MGNSPNQTACSRMPSLEFLGFPGTPWITRMSKNVLVTLKILAIIAQFVFAISNNDILLSFLGSHECSNDL